MVLVFRVCIVVFVPLHKLILSLHGVMSQPLSLHGNSFVFGALQFVLGMCSELLSVETQRWFWSLNVCLAQPRGAWWFAQFKFFCIGGEGLEMRGLFLFGLCMAKLACQVCTVMACLNREYGEVWLAMSQLEMHRVGLSGVGRPLLEPPLKLFGSYGLFLLMTLGLGSSWTYL